MNFFFGNLYFDLVHICSSRSTLRPFDKPPDLERIALRNGFDGSVWAIAYPPCNVELLRTLPHGFAKADALNATRDSKAAGDFQRPLMM